MSQRSKNAGRVFISHASKDRTMAEQVCALLERAGVECWIAPRDVRPGFSYDEEIIDAIEHCSAMVVLLSSSANESAHVKREIELAVEEEKLVFPVRIENISIGRKFRYLLAGKQWVDAFDDANSEDTIEHIARVLSEHTGLPRSADVKPVDALTDSAGNSNGEEKAGATAADAAVNEPSIDADEWSVRADDTEALIDGVMDQCGVPNQHINAGSGRVHYLLYRDQVLLVDGPHGMACRFVKTPSSQDGRLDEVKLPSYWQPATSLIRRAVLRATPMKGMALEDVVLILGVPDTLAEHAGIGNYWNWNHEDFMLQFKAAGRDGRLKVVRVEGK